MSEETRQDVRKLLKTFGVKADQAIGDYLAQTPGDGPLHLRITLEPIDDSGATLPGDPVLLEVKGDVRR
jgi:hypothetical protein